MKVIDKNALDEFLQGDDELLADLASMFCRFLPDMQARMRLAIENVDADGLREIAHQLKSRLGYFSATELQRLAAELESQAKDGSMERAACCYERIVNGCHELVQELQTYTGLELSARED